MKYAKRSKLPRGLRWDAKSPHICFSWRDERGSQHQHSTHTADPAEAMAFKLRFLREKQDVVEVRKVRSIDQSRLALAVETWHFAVVPRTELTSMVRAGGGSPGECNVQSFSTPKFMRALKALRASDPEQSVVTKQGEQDARAEYPDYP
jgi:hypothetical protein